MSAKQSKSLGAKTEGEETPAGVSILDILTLPDSLRGVATWMIRQRRPVTLTEIALHIGEEETIACALIESLVERRFVQRVDVEDEPRYQTRLDSAKKRKRPGRFWKLLE